jgi:hypothetical protein
MKKRDLALFVLAFSMGSSVGAQSRPEVPAAEPSVRRWIDVQTFTLFTRYRFTENSDGVRSANQLQYKDSLRARFNFDREKRYTVNVGYFTGNTFTGTWNNLGVGNQTAFDRKDNYFKQLYASATPVNGFEVQYGGLYLNRGEGDEWLTYDDDGYLVGTRVTVRRPQALYLDEFTITRGAIGPLTTPNLANRWALLDAPNYTQVIGVKRFGQVVAGSLEYDRQLGSDILRAAVTLRLDKNAPVSAVRYEQYRRLNQNAAAGFALWAERTITKYVAIQGGYATVDQFYGGWNADRMQSGRRLFANATIPLYGSFAASVYATRALSAPYTLPIARRFDAVISYDVLRSLRRARVF